MVLLVPQVLLVLTVLLALTVLLVLPALQAILVQLEHKAQLVQQVRTEHKA
jgi:hypothetical protein